MKYDLVSVIVPVYNTKEYIESCVNALLRQTYPFIEIIMVDDGSNDGSCELLDSLAQIHPIKVMHKENGGAGSARNVGLDAASGEWIVFADSDDVYSEIAIERLLDICKSNKCDLACCCVAIDKTELSYGSESGTNITVFDRDAGLQRLLEEKILSYLHSKIYHRSLFSENLRIPEKMTFEDLYIMPEIFAKANRIAETSEKLYYYYQNRDGNVSSAKTVQHSMNLAIAQIHRYELANQLLELPKNTRDLLLFRAVRVSVGVYRRCLFKKEWKQEKTEIVKFMKRNCKDIVQCHRLMFPYKWLSVVLSMICRK